MAESRMLELAQELAAQSRAGKVVWGETGRKEVYRVYFPDVVLTISMSESPSEDPHVDDWVTTYRLDLGSESGRVIDSLSVEPNDERYELLGEIFELAERHVRDTGINKALDYLKSR